MKVTGKYYCECPQQWEGEFCEEMMGKSKKNDNLLWLLIIPAAIALLLLLLCCLFCCKRWCCPAAEPKVVEVIEEDVYQDVDADCRSVRSMHSMHSMHSMNSCHSCPSQPPVYTLSPASHPMMMNDPGSTYYSALGRPFAVAFTDNTFSAIGYASNDAGMYNQTGKRMLPSICGDEEIQVIMTGGGGSCCGGSDYGSAYNGMAGNKYAVAYNDRTFNTYSSMPRYDRTRHYN